MADYVTKADMRAALGDTVAKLSEAINDMGQRIYEVLLPMQEDIKDIKRHLHRHDKELIKLHGTQDMMLDVLLTRDPQLTRVHKN